MFSGNEARLSLRHLAVSVNSRHPRESMTVEVARYSTVLARPWHRAATLRQMKRRGHVDRRADHVRHQVVYCKSQFLCRLQRIHAGVRRFAADNSEL